MDVLELFPRHILEGDLEPALLSPLQRHAEAVLQQPERSPDASAKLAGQLTQQRELSLQEPAIAAPEKPNITAIPIIPINFFIFLSSV